MFRRCDVQRACRRAHACAGTNSAAHDKWLRCLKALQGERRVTWELERQKNSFLQPAAPAPADCRAPQLAKHLTPAPAPLLEPHTVMRPSPGFTIHVVRLLARNDKSRCLIHADCLAKVLCCAGQQTGRLLAVVARRTAHTATLTSGGLRSAVRRASRHRAASAPSFAHPPHAGAYPANSTSTSPAYSQQVLNHTLSTGRNRRTPKAEARRPRVDSWRVPRDRERAAWEAALAGRPQNSGPDAELATALMRYVLHNHAASKCLLVCQPLADPGHMWLCIIRRTLGTAGMWWTPARV